VLFAWIRPQIYRLSERPWGLFVKALKWAQNLPKLKMDKVSPTHSSVQPVEVAIRTLGVGLVAIAAVAASLTFAKYRGEQRQQDPRLTSDDSSAPSVVDAELDAIRSAGL
jgi:hypothetical protein